MTTLSHFTILFGPLLPEDYSMWLNFIPLKKKKKDNSRCRKVVSEALTVEIKQFSSILIGM